MGLKAANINIYSHVSGDPLSNMDLLGLFQNPMGGASFFDLIFNPVYDNGKTCTIRSEYLGSVDEEGCIITTNGGPKICLGPGAIKGVGAQIANAISTNIVFLAKFTKNSAPNIGIKTSASEAIKDLESNGFIKEVSKDGSVYMLKMVRKNILFIKMQLLLAAPQHH